METILEVKGMHCKGCERTVSNTLLKTKGVKSAKVDYAAEKATVEHDECIGNEILIAAVDEVGYGASLAGTKTTRKRFLGLF